MEVMSWSVRMRLCVVMCKAGGSTVTACMQWVTTHVHRAVGMLIMQMFSYTYAMGDL